MCLQSALIFNESHPQIIKGNHHLSIVVVKHKNQATWPVWMRSEFKEWRSSICKQDTEVEGWLWFTHRWEQPAQTENRGVWRSLDIVSCHNLPQFSYSASILNGKIRWVTLHVVWEGAVPWEISPWSRKQIFMEYWHPFLRGKLNKKIAYRDW